jgi:hypothetical protein
LSPTKIAGSNHVTAISPIQGGVSLFAGSTNGDVLSAFFDPRYGNAWSRWFSLGGRDVLAPNAKVAAVSSVPGGASLFVVGKDGAVWSAHFDPRVANPVWSNWYSLGGKVRPGNSIAAISSIEGGVSLFVVGLDGAVYTNFFDPRVANAQWSGWLALGGAVRLNTEIAAVSSKPGGVSLFIVGVDGTVSSKYFDPDVANAVWSEWFAMGAKAHEDASVAAVSSMRGGVSIFMVGLDDNVWSTYYDPRIPNATWAPWFSLGGNVRSNRDIAAISSVEGGLSLFTKREDGYVQRAYYDPRVANANWSDWFAVGK